MNLETANKMTEQELCDYSVKALVKQGKQALQYDLCQYSNDQGHHCAIGHITPKEDHEAYGSKHVQYLCENGYNIADPIRKNPDLFLALQSFHDEVSHVGRKMSIKCFTEGYNIDTSGEHWQQWTDLGRGGPDA